VNVFSLIIFINALLIFDTGQRCVPVLFEVLCALIGQPMSELRSSRVLSQLSDRSNFFTFVHALNVFVSFAPGEEREGSLSVKKTAAP
jgi:hypothetical protein